MRASVARFARGCIWSTERPAERWATTASRFCFVLSRPRQKHQPVAWRPCARSGFNIFQCQARLTLVSVRNSRESVRVNRRHGHAHRRFCGRCIHAGDEFVERSSAAGHSPQEGFAIGALDARTPLPRLSLESLDDKLLVLHGDPPSRMSLSRIMAGAGRYYVTMLNGRLKCGRSRERNCRSASGKKITLPGSHQPRNSVLHRPDVKTSFSEPASPHSRRPQVRS